MIIIGLDNKEYKINLSKYSYQKNRKRSELCETAIHVIKQIYSSDPICEEIYLPGAESKIYLDIFLPKRNLAIEIDGQQHSSWNSFHYASKHDFYRAKRRDQEKFNLLEFNKIRLIRLPYDDVGNWYNLIVNPKLIENGL